MTFLHNMSHSLGYFWPLSESDFYRLLKTLKQAGNSMSKLKAVLEAVTFCRYSFAVPDLHDLTVSKRCMGAIADGAVGKVNQADPLSVRDIERLHEVLEVGHVWDRTFAGAALFCTYSRARWSDFVHGSCIRIDENPEGFIFYADMEVHIHKTMHAAANRFKFLDLVATGSGISGFNWIACWIDAMQTLGISVFDGQDGKTLMPAPGDDGQPLSRAVETDEAGKWLRLLLGESLERRDSWRKISSHSLKATVLSMAAKRGISHEDRLALGHHIHPFRMADTYARDAQARSIRLVDKLLLEIRCGYFLPDETRAGRFDMSRMPTQEEDIWAERFSSEQQYGEQLNTKVDAVLDMATQVATSPDAEPELMIETSSSSSDSESESVQLEPRPKLFYPPKAPDGFCFVQNKRTKTLHLVDDMYPSGTCCGRVIDKNYVDPAQIRYDSAVCHLCRRHRMT